MAETRQRGSRQKAFRQRQKDKQLALERQQQGLSERVAALQQERDQLQRAVEHAFCDAQGNRTGSCGQLPDNDEIAVTFCFGEVVAQLQLTYGEVRALDVEAMAGIWKRLMQKMGSTLDKVDAAPKDPRLRSRLEDMVQEALAFLWALVLNNPRLLSTVTACNMEAPKASQCSSNHSQDWSAILARMQMNERQAELLVGCRRTLLRELGSLIGERDRLWTDLQGIKDVEERTEGAMTHYVKLAGLTERLRANVRSLHTCRAFYQSYACTKVLLPLQTARYLVGSYPMGPDMLALMSCLAKQSGEPSTIELLQMARPGTAAATKLLSDPFSSIPDWRSALLQPRQVLWNWPESPEPELDLDF